MGVIEETHEWLDAAPEEVKRMFADTITVVNFWFDQRNRSFQMIGAYDGAMSEECKSLCRQNYAISTAIVDKSIEWRAAQPKGESDGKE